MSSRSPGLAVTAHGAPLDLLLLVLLPSVARLALLGRFELSEDEAYYWEWSRRLDWSYHDQGPGVALAIRAGTSLFGHTPFGVRCMAVALLGGALLFAYLLLRRMYGRAAAVCGALLLESVPLFALAGVLMLHESVQAFFWSLALYAAWRAAAPGAPAGALRWWLLTGLCVGLGFDGKYTMLLFAPALAAFLALDRDDRRWLRRPHPWLAAAAAALAASPVWVWNQRHGWASLHQVAELALRGDARLHPLGFLGFVGTQLLAVTPLLYGLLLWRLRAAWRDGVRGPDRRARFLCLFSVVYAGPFYALALASTVYANWPGLGYLPAFLLLAGWAGPRLREREFRRSPPGLALLLGAGLAAAASGVLYLHLVARVLPLPGHLDPAKRFTGWSEMGRWAHAIAADYAARGRPVHYYARSYQIAALLAFYVPGQPRVFEVKHASRSNQYDQWEDLPAGADALLVVHRDQTLPEITRRSFAEIAPLEDRTLEVTRRGSVAQRFRAYHCRDYRPAAP